MEEVCEGKDFSLPKHKEEILRLWMKIKAFEAQLERTKDSLEYVFYDGPLFAIELLHYGHILAGTIKDIVTRCFGWDYHGLLVENEIDHRLNIKKCDDVLKLQLLPSFALPCLTEYTHHQFSQGRATRVVVVYTTSKVARDGEESS